MAVVDSLLGLVESQRARGLVIRSGEAPQLVFDAERRPLSMPPIPATTVAEFARDVAADTDSGSGSRYETPAGSVFDVRVDGDGPSLRLTFTPAGADVAPAPPAAASLESARQAATPHRESTPIPSTASAPTAAVDVRLLDLLGRLEREHASDLLLSSGLPPRMRAGGVLHTLEGPVLDDDEILALLGPAVDDLARERLAASGSVDLALDLSDVPYATRFRVNLFRQQRGLAAALRPIRLDPPTLSELGLPDSLYELASYPNGLVLVTGPAGSGKSTTLVALIEHVNRRATRHIVTLEDPIEYQYTPARSLVHQRELGRHVESFGDGLRAALREAPDIILVGEMRDRETIAAALTAAETGHLVLSTLHSANPWMAVDRMIDVFPAEQQAQVRTQLAVVLRAVLSQHLLVSTTPPARVPAYEKLVVTAGAANQIREGKARQLQSTIQTGRDDGMVSLESSLAELVHTRRLEAAPARALARDVQLFAELLRGSGG